MNINEILQVPESQRDPAWENQFFQALMQTQFRLLSPEPQTGPDNWPYLLVEIDEKNGTESVHQILNWLAERGIGLVINPMKEYPDYVFSYGMIWSFKETGLFFRPTPPQDSGVVQFNIGNLVHAGSPTEQYLPNYVRTILKNFFTDQGIFKLRILLISTDRLNYDLAISLESLGNPPENEHQGIAEAISWFLPPHYSLLLVSEEGMPPFFDL